MTAVEARSLIKKTEESQEMKRQEQERLLLERIAKNRVYIKENLFPTCLKSVLEGIEESCKKLQPFYIYHYENSQSTDTLKYLMELLAERLMSSEYGYQVEVISQFVPKNPGSGEDGYAYAHDSYIKYYIRISWEEQV